MSKIDFPSNSDNTVNSEEEVVPFIVVIMGTNIDENTGEEVNFWGAYKVCPEKIQGLKDKYKGGNEIDLSDYIVPNEEAVAGEVGVESPSEECLKELREVFGDNILDLTSEIDSEELSAAVRENNNIPSI